MTALLRGRCGWDHSDLCECLNRTNQKNHIADRKQRRIWKQILNVPHPKGLSGKFLKVRVWDLKIIRQRDVFSSAKEVLSAGVLNCPTFVCLCFDRINEKDMERFWMELSEERKRVQKSSQMAKWKTDYILVVIWNTILTQEVFKGLFAFNILKSNYCT